MLQVQDQPGKRITQNLYRNSATLLSSTNTTGNKQERKLKKGRQIVGIFRRQPKRHSTKNKKTQSYPTMRRLKRKWSKALWINILLTILRKPVPAFSLLFKKMTLNPIHLAIKIIRNNHLSISTLLSFLTALTLFLLPSAQLRSCLKVEQTVTVTNKIFLLLLNC